MAGGKRHAMGELAAWHAAMIIARIPWTGTALNPAKINPYRTAKIAAKSEKMLALEKWQSEMAWKCRLGMEGA